MYADRLALSFDYERVQRLPARGPNVWLARCRRSGRIVVVTECSDSLAHAAHQAVGRDLGNVSPLLWTGTPAQTASPCLVSLYIGGLTLRELVLLDGPLEPSRALRIVESAAQGLAAMHGCDAVHGFLSDQCIIVRPNDQAILAFAAPTDENVWHSPERLRLRDHRPSRQDDLWALHMVLLSVLLGRVPIQRGSTPKAVLSAFESGALSRAVGALGDDRARRVVSSALSVAPEPLGTSNASSDASTDLSARTRQRWRRRVMVGTTATVLIGLSVLAFVTSTRQFGSESTTTKDEARIPDASMTAVPIRSASFVRVARPSRAPATDAEAIAPSFVDACVRRHFFLDAFRPEHSLVTICEQNNGRALVETVTREMVLASHGQLTDSMNEWSRLQGFQCAAIGLVRARCCRTASRWQTESESEQSFWESVDALGARPPAIQDQAIADFHTLASGRWWWYEARPCTGGQLWFDRFASRNGWKVSASQGCQMVGP